MKLGNVLGVVAACGVTMIASVASAQEPAPTPPPAAPPPTAPMGEAQPAPAPAPVAVAPAPAVALQPTMAPPPAALPDGRANGFMLQARMQATTSLTSIGGGPSFMLGYQGPNYALGLGIGLQRVGASTTADNLSASVSIIQVVPTAMIDVWHSADGRAHANLVGAIGYGRASGTITSDTQSCSIDGFGNQNCTTKSEEQSVGASFLPFMLGFGGDYFLSRNFALGTEVGLQGLVTTGIDSTSGGTTTSIDGSGNLQVFYAALRATFIIGD